MNEWMKLIKKAMFCTEIASWSFWVWRLFIYRHCVHKSISTKPGSSVNDLATSHRSPLDSERLEGHSESKGDYFPIESCTHLKVGRRRYEK